MNTTIDLINEETKNRLSHAYVPFRLHFCRVVTLSGNIMGEKRGKPIKSCVAGGVNRMNGKKCRSRVLKTRIAIDLFRNFISCGRSHPYAT
ncbi:MAG: hypothetical protein H6562_02245 [Lewinellaceae bacterium]|nr:hypothetical protein [Lewinellaceae bacterium]